MSRQIRVSPSLASMLLGVSERSIRRAIKNKELKIIIVHSRYKIDFENLLEWSNRFPNRIKKRDKEGIGQFVKEWKI